jgi:hypothetical protein
MNEAKRKRWLWWMRIIGIGLLLVPVVDGIVSQALNLR